MSAILKIKKSFQKDSLEISSASFINNPENSAFLSSCGFNIAFVLFNRRKRLPDYP
jgi:hypothetical protein